MTVSKPTGTIRWPMVTCLLAMALVIALWLTGFEASWAKADGLDFHLPYIQKIQSSGFYAALLDPGAAMPPFFHCVAAMVAQCFDTDPYQTGRLLSLLSALAVMVLLFGLFAWQERRSAYWYLCLLALLFSWPLISSALSPVTDAFAALLFLLILLCVYKGVLWPLVALVPMVIMTRQYYAFLLGVLLASLLYLRLYNNVPQQEKLQRYFNQLLLALLAGMAALGLIAYAWGGFVPPNYERYFVHKTAISLGAITLCIVYVGWLVLLSLMLRILKLPKRSWAWGLLLAIGLYVLLPVDANRDAGRWGSIFWKLSTLGTFKNVNLLFYGLMASFAAFAHMMCNRMMRVPLSLGAVFFVFSALGIAGIFSLQPFAWQRYVDPMLAFVFVFFVAHVQAIGSKD